MTKPLILAALAALPLATPALALTPDELWASWQARAADFGATVTAEAVDGADGSLTLEGLTLTAPDDGPASLPFPVTLRPGADGSVLVEVAVPSSFDIPADSEAGTSAVRITQTGTAITARDGADGVIAYEVAAASLSVVTMPDEGTGAEASVFDLALEVAGASLRFADRPDAQGGLAVGLSADGMAYVLDTLDPFAGASHGTSRVEDVAFDLAVTVPPGLDLAAMAEMDGADAGPAFLRALDDGLAMRLDMAVGANEGTTSATGGLFEYEYAVTGGEANAGVTFDASSLAMTATGGGSTASGTSPMLPGGTAEIGVGPYDMEILVPLGAEPGPFRYRVAVDEITLSDTAWDAFDPTRALPREPARLVVDVTGTGTLDMAAMVAAATPEAAGEAAAVPEITSLEIAALDVAAAGMRLTGEGSFTFGPPDAMGMPVPAGEAVVTLEGINRLLDALVTMGVVPEAEAGQARLGLAMAFDPGEGEDVLTSTIEARADGSILVNGQRMK